MAIYGDGTKLQSMLLLFTSLVSLGAICMGIIILRNLIFVRWHIAVITLAFASAMGIAAVAATHMLELQVAEHNVHLNNC